MVMRKVKVGKLEIGTAYPVRIESMLKVPLQDPTSCRDQLERLKRAGCELVRIAFPDIDLKYNLFKVAGSSKIPVMADIHFDHRLALCAIEAGCEAIRINPGNMQSKKGLREVIDAAKANSTVIRIGANSGSLNSRQIKESGGDPGKALFLAVEEQLKILDKEGFENIILSAKSTSINYTIRSNLMLSKKYPQYPFHIGITEAGPGLKGVVKSSCGLTLLLNQGVGDTLRVSLTGDPCQEVETGYEVLRAAGMRDHGVELISCPTCGRKRADVLSILDDIEPLLAKMPDGFKFAVMGCEVNGPREASSADLGIAGTPRGIVIFREGKTLGEYTSDKVFTILEDILEDIEKDRKFS